MRNILMLVCVACLSVSCRKEASSKAMTLISRFEDAWKDSSQSFATISHQACAEIAAIVNHSNRLGCVIAYQEAVLGLPKYLRECDEDGFWARLNAQAEIERRENRPNDRRGLETFVTRSATGLTPCLWCDICQSGEGIAEMGD